MELIFSTSGLHARDRFDYWHEVACRTIVGHESKPLTPTNFAAELTAVTLAGLPLVVFENSPMDVSRTRQHISQAASDDLFLCRQMTGTLALQQQERALTLTPGDFCLLDPMSPYNGRFGQNSRLLVAKIDRGALEARTGKTTGITACTLLPTALGRLTSEYLGSLPDCIDVPGYQAAVIKEQLLDLVGLGLSALLNKSGTVSSSRALALVKIRTAIAERLADPRLSPSSVAAAVGISVRYANMLLAPQNLSLRRLIIKLRLDRCHAALADAAFVHRTISEIAFAWGFSDLSHFSRVFKHAYGVSPREFRRSLHMRVREAH